MNDYLDLDDQTAAEVLAITSATLNARIARRDAEIERLRALNAELVTVCKAAVQWFEDYESLYPYSGRELEVQLMNAIDRAQAEQAPAPDPDPEPRDRRPGAMATQ